MGLISSVMFPITQNLEIWEVAATEDLVVKYICFCKGALSLK